MIKWVAMQASKNFQDLVYLMQILRQKCPWDAKQTNHSLLPYLLEESYELAESILQGDDEEIQGELADVLLQVVFHAQLYAEQNKFDIGDVIETLMQKLIRRHPHVFNQETLADEDAVEKRWQEIKLLENQGKKQRRLLKVKSGSALMQASSIQKTAAKFGFDWEDYQGALNKLHEEIGEVQDLLTYDDGTFMQQSQMDKERLESEIGDCLFALVNVARKLKIDSEQALLKTIYKFKNRFAYIEDELQKQGLTPEQTTLEHMDELWDAAKKLGL